MTTHHYLPRTGSIRYGCLAVLTALCLSGLAPAQAAPITWTASGTFDDGGTLSGTFVFDADTTTYSDLNLLTTTAYLLGDTYTIEGNTADFCDIQSATTFQSVGDTPTACLWLFFASPLTNAGGTIALLTSSLESGLSIDDDTATRYLVSGSVSAAVPVPAAVWLFGGALGVLGFLRRRARSI